MDTPLVSAVIPTYNRANVVGEAIQSTLQQTYENIEVLVVDDHSTDNTKEVVESFDDSRVRYLLNQRTKGAQGARNTGIDEANGEWVAFLDSDDRWMPEKLSKQLKYIEESDEEVHALATGFVRERNGQVWRRKQNENCSWNAEAFLRSTPVGNFSVLIARRNVLVQVGGLDEGLPAMQDMDLFYRVSKNYNFCSMVECLVVISTDANNRISSKYEDKLHASIAFFEKHYEDITKRDLYIYRGAYIAFFALLARRWDVFRKYVRFFGLGLYHCPLDILFLCGSMALKNGGVRRVYRSFRQWKSEYNTNVETGMSV